MAGILDSKKRIMDTIVLPTGRTQAFGGHMQFRYVTLTDRHAIYESTGSDSLGNRVAEDASKNVYFEATARPHDMLCPETDLNSKIIFDTETIFQNSDVVGMSMGDMLTIQGAFPTEAALTDQSKVSTGQDYLDYFLASNITQALTSSYVHQHFLSSVDPLHPFKDFKVNKNVLNMPCSHRGLPNHNATTTKKLNPLYLDEKFFRHTNFQFLPPVNKLPPYAKMQRVLPWVVSNLDLKQFSFLDYRNYFGILESNLDPAALETWKAFEVLKDDKIKAMGAGTMSLKGATLSAYESYYAINESAEGYLQDIDAEWAAIAAASELGISSNEVLQFLTRAALPILMSGKQLNEVDFAIARACYMGSYDVDGPLPRNYQFTIGKFFDYHIGNHEGDQGTLPASSFRFTETSRYNNIILQMFEFNSTTSDASPMSKLVIVPGGTLSTAKGDDTADLYYLGKLFWDPDDQQPRFVSIFHLLLASSDIAALHGLGNVPGLMT